MLCCRWRSKRHGIARAGPAPAIGGVCLCPDRGAGSAADRRPARGRSPRHPVRRFELPAPVLIAGEASEADHGTEPMSINRRRLLRSALAVPADASVVLAQSRSPAPGGSGDDAALLAAERRVAELRAQKEALWQRGRLGEIEDDDAIIKPLSDEQFALEDFIALTPCQAAVGAAVKLRSLADEIAGPRGEGET